MAVFYEDHAKLEKNMYICDSNNSMDFKEKFILHMTLRLLNLHFSPELSAKCTIIDFTATLKGLKKQLLGNLADGGDRPGHWQPQPAAAPDTPTLAMGYDVRIPTNIGATEAELDTIHYGGMV